ncbi:BTAD domain-containing putative transcriptional regulator [Actinoplanes sp. NPDC024001]|uniref:AfsR/SARP family transcriptional regulator n=1 Tax=Actinoplanes sp. NPDC024001 TaxID=3154598 RepID=UPI0033F77561
MFAEEVATEGSGSRLIVGVLGPLVVSLDGHAVPVRSPRLRTFLAVLALSAGGPVLYDRLATVVWGDDQPKDARRALQLYVTRLRQLLKAELIRTVPGGYVLATRPELVDAVRFGRLLDAAARAADTKVERMTLVEALALWRGEPFDGVRSAWLESVEAPHLSALRLAALERRIELDLTARRTGGLIAEIEDLTARYPLREQYWGYLMTALAYAGRRADALGTYQRLYRLLAEELGIEPGRPLRELHRRILDGEAASDAPAEIQVPGPPAPRQLPATVNHFVGRGGALARLDACLPTAGDAAPVAVTITGAAGTGKTALAVHWAHRVTGRFPDGQLYVNLRGSAAAGPPLLPADAIRHCLNPLGIAPHHLPADLDARAGLYRTLVAGKRILLVLDDARDSHQIRPLLPGAGGCMVVVTSRDELAGLVAYDGAQPLELDVLTAQEAVWLLTVRLGPERVAAEPEAVREIVEHCGRRPPALNAVAARAVRHPALPLAALAGQV